MLHTLQSHSNSTQFNFIFISSCFYITLPSWKCDRVKIRIVLVQSNGLTELEFRHPFCVVIVIDLNMCIHCWMLFLFRNIQIVFTAVQLITIRNENWKWSCEFTSSFALGSECLKSYSLHVRVIQLFSCFFLFFFRESIEVNESICLSILSRVA